MLPPTKYVYVLSEGERQQFAGMFLLRKMVLENLNYGVALFGDDVFLEGTLNWLYSENWVEILRGKYVPTSSGREHLKLFEERYQDFLKVFYALRFVSTKNTQAAFRFYYSVPEAEFTAFTQDPAWEWEDLRLAAAELKGLNGLEVVFMSHLNEGQFDNSTSAHGWQFDLHSGLQFVEMVKTANSLLHADQLGNADVSSEDVLKAVILDCGEIVMMNLAHAETLRQQRVAEEARLIAEQAAQRQQAQTQTQRVVEYETVLVPETTYIVVDDRPITYYDEYRYNPLYISPIWHTPWYY